MPRLQLPLHSYEDRSKPASSSRLQNCYIEPLPPDAKTPFVLTRAPGIKSLGTVGDGPIRGMLRTYGEGYPTSVPKGDRADLWAVSGPNLYSVPPSGSSSTIRVAVGNPVNIDMAANTTDIVVVNEPDAFFHTIVTGSVNGQITDTDFTDRGALAVEFLDNFLLFVEPDTGRFFGADVGSTTSFDALNFVTAESSPDNIIGMKADHEQLILLGQENTELWQNTGISGFPFERTINGVLELGGGAGKSLTKQDHTVFWLADDETIRRLVGLTPTRVSTHAIEQVLSEQTNDAATSFSYTQEGHLFVVYNLDSRTFVFDVTTGAWHERVSYGKNCCDAKYHAFVYGKNVVGDFTSNRIGVLDPDTFEEWGDPQVMSWTYQTIYAEGARVFHDRLEIVMETGVGLTTGQGSDPQIMLEFSDNGGITYTSLPDKSIGKIGEY